MTEIKESESKVILEFVEPVIFIDALSNSRRMMAPVFSSLDCMAEEEWRGTNQERYVIYVI